MVKRHERIRGTSVGIPGGIATLTEARNSNSSGARERNRVSRIFNGSLRGILSIIAILASIFMAKSQDLVFDGITPASGSEISSFDFVLKFDLSKIIENNGQAEYGVGWVGYHNDKRPTKEESVTIYKGDPADKIVIGRCCDDYYNGGDADFIPSSEVKISVPGAIPEPGVTYTMVICNEFEVYTKENGAKPYPNSLIDYFTNPITYTFTGAAVSGEKLSIASCSVNANQSIDELKEVTFTFSQPVSINGANPLVVKENDAVYAISVDAILSEDKTSVIYKFDNVPLRISHSYVISLPEGAVTSTVNASETNAVFNIPVTGSYINHFMIESSIPSSEQKTVFTTVEGIFDMPEGYEISVQPPYTLNLYGYLYKNEVSEDNLIGRLDGEVNSTNNGIVWTNTFALEPASTYILNKPANEFKAREIETAKYSNDWSNGEVNIVLNTPSIADSGIPPFIYQNPVSGQYDKTHTVLEPNAKVDYIGTFELALKDLNYQYEGTGYLVSIANDAKLNVYDITDGQETLVREATISTREIEPEDWHIPNYRVWKAAINTYFLEGHKYKLVIPAGALSVNYTLLKKYAINEEWTLELEGGTPTTVELTDCTLTDNEELSELSSVTWTFKGGFAQNTDASVLIKYKTTLSSSLNICTTVVRNYGSYTKVSAYLPATNTGGAYQFDTKRTYQITLPEGLIYYEGDPSIKNSEMVYNIIPVAKTPEVVEPEFVDVKIVTNDFMTTTQKAVKGKPFTYSMGFNSAEEGTPARWEVTSVRQGGTELEKQDGSYTTAALTGDTTLNVEVDYTGNWAFEDKATGIWSVEGSSLRIYGDGQNIVVEGAEAGSVINVYNVAGMLVNSDRISDGKDKAVITVASGQVYIVTVNGIAARIVMTNLKR